MLAAVSPRLDMGRCSLDGMRAYTAIRVTARRPRIDGPFVANRFVCPTSNMLMEAPRFDLNSQLQRKLHQLRRQRPGHDAARHRRRQRPRGNDRATSASPARPRPPTAGSMPQRSARGSAPSMPTARASTAATCSAPAAARFRSSPIIPRRMRDLAPSVLASVTDPLAAADKTPIGPIAVAISNAIRKSGKLIRRVRLASRWSTSPAAARRGSRRPTSAAIPAARVRVSGGDGVTYYWPSGRLRVDGLIEMAGGGLPQGQVLLRQPRSGAPMSGVARFAPYQAGALAPRARSDPLPGERDGATNFDTVALLDGPFPDGRVQALPPAAQRPARHRPAASRSAAAASSPAGASSSCARSSSARPGCRSARSARRSCRSLRAAISASRRGSAIPRLNGRLGKRAAAPWRGRSADRRQAILGGRPRAAPRQARSAGRSSTPSVCRARSAAAESAERSPERRSTIGNVQLLFSDADGRWRFYNGDLTVNGALNLSDRTPDAALLSAAEQRLSADVEGR